MQLPFLKNNKPQKNFFLSLLIKPDKVGAILFEEINSKLFILSSNETSLTKSSEEASGEELLLAADKVITFVEGSLPEGESVEKTIFSVPYDWIVEGKIKPEYLNKLKKMCEELGLVPVGYLIAIEAIVHYLEKVEGVPVSALFVEVAGKNVFVYLVKASKILEVHQENAEDILSATESLLSRIVKADVLPSKIILLDYKGAENVQQEFLSHTWPENISFLHIPQVVVLEKGIENEATINGVASQMELEVLQDIKINPDQVGEQEKLKQSKAQDFGFVKDQDLKEKEEEATLPVSDNLKVEDELGNKEFQQNPVFAKIGAEEKTSEPDVSYFDQDEQGEQEVSSQTHHRQLAPISAAGVMGMVKNIKLPEIPNISKFKFSTGGPAKFKIIGAAAVIIVSIILFSMFYYNVLLKADVVIFTDKKAINETVDVTFVKGGSVSDKEIPIDIVEEEVSGDDTKNSTGKKETGEKATGTITIYNKAEQKKTFPKGSTIIGPDNLEFVLQEEVQIASTSSFSTTLANSKGKVEAAKFGKEYNLPSNTNFTIEGTPTSASIAKNESAFSGGTKKETTVVAQKDLDELLKGIATSLQKEAVDKAKSGVGGNDIILPNVLSSDVVTQKYTKKVGDEASSVGISATIKYSIGKYTKDDLQKLVESLSKDNIPGSYVFQEGESNVEITDVEVDKNQASAKIKVNAVYKPKIENDILAKAIKGKSEKGAIDEIKQINGVSEVTVILKNQIPIFPKLLPQNTGNISIEVKD